MHVTLIHGWVGGPAGGGGGSRHMLDQAHRLLAAGHEVTVACYDHEPGSELSGDGRPLDIRSVRTGPFEARTGKRVAIQRFWREMPLVARLVPPGTDVIHAHEWPALHAGRLAGRRLDAPFVWSRNDHTIWERALVPGARHGVELGRARRLIRAAGSLGDYLDARRAAAILVFDEASRQMAERAYRRPVEIIPAPPTDHFFDPPDRAAARRRLGVPDGVFLVLGVGIMNPHRRFEDLVDALAQLPREDVRALIVGSDHVDPGYGRGLRERIDAAGLGARVSLPLRSFDEAELRDAYAAADVFVFPNDHRQSWGLAPLEALASGTPVILTSAAGVADVIGGRPGVTVVAPTAPEEIAGAIATLLEDPGRHDPGVTRDWVEAELGGRRYISRLVGVYERALGRRTG